MLFCDREVETVNQPAVAALEIISAGIGHARQNKLARHPLVIIAFRDAHGDYAGFASRYASRSAGRIRTRRATFEALSFLALISRRTVNGTTFSGIAAELPGALDVVRLYENYLTTFAINLG